MGTQAEILKNSPGEVLFLLGNEAVARGALEAGVSVAATYPGTPSSEVGDALFQVAEKAGMKFEFSVNEKVAMEIAYAASISGLRSFVFMKHVGLNVASDPLMSIAYTGVKGGMVIMTADDPSMFSSQNEQDNRNIAHMAHIPLIEPSSPQEAKDFLVAAFELSEEEGIPVLFRTTTRVSHQRSTVKLGHLRRIEVKGNYVSDPRQHVSLPINARPLRKKLEDKILRISMSHDRSMFNKTEEFGKPQLGIVTSGEAYSLVHDVVTKNKLNVSILKLGLTNPLPNGLVSEFLEKHRTVVVVEELDPFLETRLRARVQSEGLKNEIIGKLDGVFPVEFEYDYETVLNGLEKVIKFDSEEKDLFAGTVKLPERPPVLCPGCPHRATYYAVKRAAKMMKLKDPIYTSDIGCYSLGFYEPFNEADTMICMGASEGLAIGFSKSVDNHVISFIGDSTFFHSGMAPLVDAIHNRAKFLLVVMDNGTTAMTGQQPNPGNEANHDFQKISIEDVAKSIGVPYVKTVDPYDLGATLRTMTEALKQDSVAVVVARRECAILRDGRLRREGTIHPYVVNQDKCSKCMNCVENFACPAMSISGGNIVINPTLCDGCGVCAQPYVCPFRAIEVA